MNSKVKSFTLSELLVTMIITVIVVGLAFTVLDLVRKQIIGIQKNYNRTTEFAFLKQRIWLDFNKNNNITFNLTANQIVLKSEFDTIYYSFKSDFILRNKDTLKSTVKIEKIFFKGNEITQGNLDAISFFDEKESAHSHFFVFKNNDATFLMNQNGF
ncbi:MAG: hypothetical protein H7239_01530 [Flavobacterium sp.]|nr:hypothetical protein [Flavobacterium sp.]